MHLPITLVVLASLTRLSFATFGSHLWHQSEHPVVGRIRHPRPASASFGVDDTLRPAPRQGEQTLEILAELGLSSAEAERLVADKHVRVTS